MGHAIEKKSVTRGAKTSPTMHARALRSGYKTKRITVFKHFGLTAVEGKLRPNTVGNKISG